VPQEDYVIWRRPRHHMDVENPNEHVQWVELFFDLIHVVTIFILGNYLSDHLDLQGFLVFSGLFLAVFFAWADSSIYNSLYISTDVPHRAVMALQIVTMMVIAAAIPAVGAGGWPYFALGYALNRALTGWLYWRARHVGAGGNRLALEQGRNFLALAALFAVSALLPRPLAYWTFGLGVVLVQVQYVAPRLGTLRFERFAPRLGHLSERFALLMLILLGEGFFKLVVTLADKGIDKVGPGTLINLVIGGLSLFALAWIYFDAVGNAPPRSNERSVSLRYWFAHIAAMWGAVLIGVALAGEVYVGLWEPFPSGYAVLGTIGLGVFLVSIGVLQTQIEGRETVRRHYSGGVRLFGIATALLVLAVHPFVPAVVGNLGWGLALFSQIAVPLRRAIAERHEQREGGSERRRSRRRD